MYYNLKRLPDGYRMVKFDSLFNVEAVYNIRFSRGRFYCDCPASNKPDCKHRQMVPIFSTHKAIDSGKFLNFDTGEWIPAMEGIPNDLPLQQSQRPRRVSRSTRKRH